MATDITLPLGLDRRRELRTNPDAANLICNHEKTIFDSRVGPSLQKRLRRIREREGDDAAITGGTRSLHRRLLALNIYETSNATQTQKVSLPPASNY